MSEKPQRTLDDVQVIMREARQQGGGTATAGVMLMHVRMTAEAREWLTQEYSQGKPSHSLTSTVVLQDQPTTATVPSRHHQRGE